MEATVANGAVGLLRRIPSRARRLASFVMVSFALHALTLITIGPSGVAGAPYNGTAQPEPLRATLQPRSVDAISANATAEAKNPPDEQQSAVGAERAGIPGGVD